MANTYDKASLVLIPSGTKEGTIFSQKPTNGDGDFTFSRSTSATRVGPSGYIEKETENQILYSQDFSNVAWSKVSHTIVSNAAVAPDGTTTADKLVADNGLDPAIANSSGVFQNRTIPSSLYTISVYAKAAEFTSIRFRENYIVGSFLTIDLTNGSITGGGSQYSDAKAVSVGNGWYRISFFYNQTTGNPSKYTLRCADVGDGTSGVYIWGYQQEQGLVARDYIETTTSAVYGGITDNIPRLDYNGSCPSLLLEPQRTNLWTQSEYLESANFGDAQILNTTDTTPEGSSNARILAYNGGTNQHYLAYVPSVTNGETYTFSVFLKKKEVRYAALIFLNDFRGRFFDLEIGSILGTIGSGSLVNSKIEDYGNGWYRCSITDTATSTTKFSGVYLCNSATSYGGFTPTNTDGFYAYGAQLEEGSYATSYIPTYGSAVTRNSDNSIVTSASNLIGQTEGTLFIECEYPRTGSGGSARKLISVNDGSSANLVDIFVNAGANTLTARVRANSGGFGSIGISNNPTGVVKIAYAYKANDYVLYINGTQYGSITTGGTFTFSSELDVIQIGDGEASNDELGGKCAQTIIFKTRLTNEELAALTTI